MARKPDAYDAWVEREREHLRLNRELSVYVDTKGFFSATAFSDFLEVIVLKASESGKAVEFHAEIESIHMGSLEILFAFTGIWIGIAQLAFQIADHFRKNPFAALAAAQLERSQRGPPAITVSAAGVEHFVSSAEIKAALPQYVRDRNEAVLRVTGFHMGRYYVVEGKPYAILDHNLGSLIVVVDERIESADEPLEAGRRYMFEGTLAFDREADTAELRIARAIRQYGSTNL